MEAEDEKTKLAGEYKKCPVERVGRRVQEVPCGERRKWSGRTTWLQVNHELRPENQEGWQYLADVWSCELTMN